MKEYYLKKADENLPKIEMENISVPNEAKALNSGDSFVLDLGNHYVGYLSFVLGFADYHPDAPTRLAIKFCESRYELERDFSSYKGTLCSSWLQEQIVDVDTVGVYKMPRRYAARYIKVTVLASPKNVILSDFTFSAVTSAKKERLAPLEISDPELQSIDRVAVNTLKNCMHRVFEDGPKRDRRLWIGDLRLEALADYYTYDQVDLVRRCLYLFAAEGECKDGFMRGFVYENPEFFSGNWTLIDYALLFVVSLCDYYLHTGDRETFFDIYPIAKKQMETAAEATDQNGIISTKKGGGAFIDWCEELEKKTSLHGVYLYTLDTLYKTLQLLDHDDASVYLSRYCEAREAALRHLYNKENGNLENAYDNYKTSVHSAVWMILGGVLEGDEAFSILKNAIDDEKSAKPVTPYMNHYLVEAMIKLGKKDIAAEHIKSFWGAMVREGADTFYEVFVPGKPDVSPYGDRLINSMCHAWSCTPSYFIRKYFACGENGEENGKI